MFKTLAPRSTDDLWPFAEQPQAGAPASLMQRLAGSLLAMSQSVVERRRYLKARHDLDSLDGRLRHPPIGEPVAKGVEAAVRSARNAKHAATGSRADGRMHRDHVRDAAQFEGLDQPAMLARARLEAVDATRWADPARRRQRHHARVRTHVEEDASRHQMSAKHTKRVGLVRARDVKRP